MMIDNMAHLAAMTMKKELKIGAVLDMPHIL